MEEVAVAVENNFCDTGGESLLGSSLAYLGGDFNLGAFLDSLEDADTRVLPSWSSTSCT